MQLQFLLVSLMALFVAGAVLPNEARKSPFLESEKISLGSPELIRIYTGSPTSDSDDSVAYPAEVDVSWANAK